VLRSILQNSTAGFYVFASDSTTPTSGKTGLTLTVTLSKAGGTANSVSPSQSEIGNGLYWIDPIAAHRDTLGEIAWQFSASGAVIAPRLEKVVAVNDQVAAFGANTTVPDNAGVAAIRVVTDRINTGLVADGAVYQFTANMLELGPSSGGGGDAEQATLLAVQTTVNTISSQTSQITGSRINIVGPVSAAGDITLIVGKDYKVASESELTISVPDTAGALYADFTSGTLAASKAFGMSRANGDADISGTVSSVTYAANVTTFKIEIDADQLPDTLELAYDYTYQIERVTSGGDKVVGVQGAGEVKMRAV
jgi:hypothetical protein